MSKPKKERVLHTRVSDVLDGELKRLAENLRVPVSNVVRAILMDAVEAADAATRRAEGEIRNAADKLHQRREQLRKQTSDALRAGPPLPNGAPAKAPQSESAAKTAPSASENADQATPSAASSAAPAAAPLPPLAGVIGFQALMLARVSHCAVCGVELAAGTEAFLGITDRVGHTPIVGRECLPFSHRAADKGDGDKP